MGPERTRSVGRPPTIDPARVSLIALRLFERRGFDAVSMEEVARVADVSRRSLFRLFPTKAALVWGGTDDFVDRFVGALQRGDASDPPWEAVRQAFCIAATFAGDDLEVTRNRLLVIGANPTLERVGAAATATVTARIVSVVADREGLQPEGLELMLRATAMAAAARASLAWWASHGGDEPPQAVVARGLALLPFR